MHREHHIDQIIKFVRKHEKDAVPYEVLTIVVMVNNGYVFVDESVTSQLKELLIFAV